jgi:formylmethanofuran dehydrogenase subunit E
MKELEYYIQAASRNGRPPRPGIILAIRMCLLGLQRLEITEPAEHKRTLLVIVETDRCLPDAIQLVTDCRLGNRTLKLQDYGKMAATFVDLATSRAIRVAARESANRKALELYPALDREEALSLAYRNLSEAQLCDVRFVRVQLGPEDLPGYRAPRVICDQCGEGIAFRREVRSGDRTLCGACAGESYYEPL